MALSTGGAAQARPGADASGAGAATSPLTSAWGGGPPVADQDGLYHLFVAEMVNNCTLEDWGQNSQCTHATSPTPVGPYTMVDTALGVWCQ